MLRWLAESCGRLARALTAAPPAPQSLRDMRRELVKLLRSVAIQEAQCEAAAERMNRLRGVRGTSSQFHEACRLSSTFLDDYADGLRMLDAAMGRYLKLLALARIGPYPRPMRELDPPVWDDDLRREARAYVAHHLDLDDRVLLEADHEAFTDRLAARSAS